ncbi:MAG: methylenetetrahydrofolate reductase [NAD(P)H] [Paracoccaceae bacterium]
MTYKTPQTTSLSFEFFPPHNAYASARLWRSVERLAPLGPKYVSVTYGAGGTTRERTVSAIKTIQDRARLNVAGHLTLVGASKAETLDVAGAYAQMGVRRIVALRGDALKGQDQFTAHPDGFQNASELVAGLKEIGEFDISVAAYPEKHPDSADMIADIDNLKCKIDAGASSAITQFFFENDDFLRFRDAAADAGISAPIIPGILPVENFTKMLRFADMCQANVPDWMHRAFRNAGDDAEVLATAICAEQCDELQAEGVDHLHFYTLNKPDLVYNICRALGFEVTGVDLAASVA